MTRLRLILLSLLHYRRMHAAVAIGVIAGTAVLTGALLVGDSMRGSLRHLTLDRLGPIDYVLATDRFFRAELADELASQPAFSQRFAAAVPVILLTASAENPRSTTSRRVTEVNLVGCDERFWNLGGQWAAGPLRGREVVLNQPLATSLGAAVGDRILVRIPRAVSVPAESSLGRKSETVESQPVTVRAVIPADGLGRFSLRPNQQAPLNAYVSLDWLANRLDEPGRADAILVAGRDATTPPPEADRFLQELLRPRAADYGIRVKKSSHGYFDITSDRLILQPRLVEAIEASLRGFQVRPVFTYLANAIEFQGREIPYSTVAAVDLIANPPFGPFTAPQGNPIVTPASGEIVLNAWAAEDLGARPGDVVTMRWFEPETHDGRVREQSGRFRVSAIAALKGAAADPGLTPEVPGVTDQLSMSQWDPPFPFEAARIRDKDEKYWEEHRATPKAFVSLAAGRKLWQSRFGRTTSLQVAAGDGLDAAALADRLEIPAAVGGFLFQPVKRQGLEASAGATPFNVLFLMLSFFIILAAMLLVALLFRLGIDQRAAEVGTLLALGFRSRSVAGSLASEGLIVASLASVLGVIAGLGYAALMIVGLKTWWVGAVVVPFVDLYVSPLSLALGYVSGIVISGGTILWAVRQTRKASAATLLASRGGVGTGLATRTSRWWTWSAALFLLIAVGIGFAAVWMSEDARAGAFFGTGSLVLAALLMLVWARLRSGATGPAVAKGRGNLPRLAVRNAARHPGRSALSIGLVAAACFLILAMGAFHLDPIGRAPHRSSGDGGFALVAETSQSVYQDLNTAAGRAELGVPAEKSALLQSARIVPLRVKAGDDASCLNLYKPQQPRMLGVPPSMIERGGFDWASSGAETAGERANPWRLLEKDLPADADGAPRVPVVIEKNTAMYALQLWNGVGETFDVSDGHGGTIRLVVVGLLNNGIFQGDLLIGEEAMLRYFPDTSGYRFFLVETDPPRTDEITAALNETLGNFGVRVETTGRRLGRFLAVQNTYLSTFQSLGGLGLLLGTLGLAAVELRNVLERRGELALLRASGFRRRTLAWLVLLENSALLIGGLAVGSLAALVALLPHLVSGSVAIPWGSLGGTLLAVLVVGLVAGLAAVRTVLAAPLLSSLRGE